MADGTQARNASVGQRALRARRSPAMTRDFRARPYTRFAREGIYRFRGIDPEFRLFRVS